MYFSCTFCMDGFVWLFAPAWKCTFLFLGKKLGCLDAHFLYAVHFLSLLLSHPCSPLFSGFYVSKAKPAFGCLDSHVPFLLPPVAVYQMKTA